MEANSEEEEEKEGESIIVGNGETLQCVEEIKQFGKRKEKT